MIYIECVYLLLDLDQVQIFVESIANLFCLEYPVTSRITFDLGSDGLNEILSIDYALGLVKYFVYY